MTLLLVIGTQAATKSRRAKRQIRAWILPAYTMIADTVRLDTSYLNLPMRNLQDDYSVSYAWDGNIVAPIQSRLYFDRLHKIEDIFGVPYQPYVITPQDVRFYNTTVPYSKIGYQHGFTTYHEEHELDFLFTGNLNKRLNLGLQLNYQNGAGHYAFQEAKLFNGAVFGSYNGDHYFLHATATWNYMSNFENGGIQNVDDLNSSLEPEDIPVRIKGMSGYSYVSGMLNHGYSLTVQRTRVDTIEVKNEEGKWEKTDTTITYHIPVITFAHTFETNNSIRRYREKDSVNAAFYDNTYRNPFQTRDTSNVLTISNTLSVTFEEEFNKLLHFGFSVYARNECQRYIYRSNEYYDPGLALQGNSIERVAATAHLMADSLTNQHWVNNTFVGGTIHKKTGNWVRFLIHGEVCPLGYKIGQFMVHGNVNLSIPVRKDTFYIRALAEVANAKPSWYYEQYISNHHMWVNDFNKEYRFHVGGEVAYPTKWVKPRVKIDFENVTNLIYFDHKGYPIQNEGNAQVFAADVRCDITTPWINLENNIIYQTASSVIPVPALILYHNLYYHGTWFKSLDTQIGVDLRYFTRYYAPILCPALGQFAVQDQVKIGNYPLMSVYANFYVRQLYLRFYVQYTHINHLFMRSNINYLAMPNYPMNPDIFRLGVTWHFYR